MLATGGLHPQHQVLRVAHGLYANDFFTELAGRAGARQQRSQHTTDITGAQGLLQLHTLGGKGFGAGAPQGLGGGQQQRAGRASAAQRVQRMAQVGQIGKMRAKRRDGRIHHTQRVGHRKLNPFVQRRAQCLVGLKAPMRQHHGFVVSLQRLIGQQGRVKTPPHQGAGRGVVFQQRVVHRQVQALQNGHRRVAQQRRKPAVKGANLYRPPGGQHRAVQVGQHIRLVGVGSCKHPTNRKLLPQRVVVGMGKFAQPLVQPLAHFTCGFFGEGDGEDFLRTQLARGRFEQRPHDARHQHPCFAGSSAGFNRHAAARVTGNRVEGFSGDRLAVALIGGFHVVFQKSLRHKPRALQ